MSELDKWKAVNSARDLEELKVVLEQIGDVEISGGRGAVNMAKRLENVVVHGMRPNQLTRNYGIRQQYLYLNEE